MPLSGKVFAHEGVMPFKWSSFETEPCRVAQAGQELVMLSASAVQVLRLSPKSILQEMLMAYIHQGEARECGISFKLNLVLKSFYKV